MDFYRLFNPLSVAVIGGNWAAEVVRQCQLAGFDGEIYPVNAHRTDMHGIKCYADIRDLPKMPDAAFIALNHEKTISTVEYLAQNGCGGAVIFAAGFAEVGGEGIARQERLIKAAGNMPILGPNCYGLINMRAKAVLWPDLHGLKPVENGVAIITQSGNIAFNFTMQRRNLPIVMTLTLGNQALVNLPMLMRAMAVDSAVKVIGIHAETLGSVAEFASAVAFLRQHNKECVILKTGLSEKGAFLAQSHTASMAGSGAMTRAFLQRINVPLASDVPEFLDACQFLLHGGMVDEINCVSFSCSGGEAGLMADLADKYQINFPPFTAESLAKLGQLHGDKVALNNPFDYHTYIWGDEEKLTENFTFAMESDAQIGILILDMPNRESMNPWAWHASLQAFDRAAKATQKRAIVLSSMAETMPNEKTCQKYPNLLFLSGFETCLRVIKMCQRHKVNYNKANYNFIQPSRLVGPTKLLPTPIARQILGQYAMPFVPSQIINQPNERTIAYPVVVKAEGLAHKTEAGGVILNIHNDSEFLRAFTHCQAINPNVLVEKMLQPPLLELLLGITRDEQFGLAMLVGEGGILTELRHDTQIILLPAGRDEFLLALQKCKIWPILQGYRQRGAVNIEKILDIMENLAKFANDHHHKIESLDINPLLCYENEIWAVDCALQMVME